MSVVWKLRNPNETDSLRGRRGQGGWVRGPRAEIIEVIDDCPSLSRECWGRCRMGHRRRVGFQGAWEERKWGQWIGTTEFAVTFFQRRRNAFADGSGCGGEVVRETRGRAAELCPPPPRDPVGLRMSDVAVTGSQGSGQMLGAGPAMWHLHPGHGLKAGPRWVSREGM